MKRITALCCVMILTLFLSATAVSAASTVSAEITVSIERGGTAVIIPQGNSPVPAVTELSLGDGEVGAFRIDLNEEGMYSYIIKQEPDGRDLTYDTSEYSVSIYAEESEEGLSAVIVVYNDEGEKVDRSQPADPSQISGGWASSRTGGVSFSNYLPGWTPSSPGGQTGDDSGSPGPSDSSPDDPTGDPAGSSDPGEDSAGGSAGSSDPGEDSAGGSAGSSDPGEDSAGGSTGSSDPGKDSAGGSSGSSDPGEESGGGSDSASAANKSSGSSSASDHSASDTDGGKEGPHTGDESRIEFYYMLAIASSAALFVLSLVYAYNTVKQNF